KDAAQAALFPSDTPAPTPPAGDQKKTPVTSAEAPPTAPPAPVPAPAPSAPSEQKVPEAAPAPTPTPAAATAPTAPPTFAVVMLSAFLGGLILNIMPCVFPVLGIKLVGVVQQAGSDRRQVVLHGLVYTLGILLSFWVLGAVVVALGKIWGFQQQSAGFTYSLAAFFLIFGLNMAGVFEIGASAVGVGSGLQRKHGLGGSFFSGLLATVVATPCSAPILGTALGATLKMPAPQAMLLFTLIGLGLASPFLLLSAFPRLVSVLPRPGAWMESFKQGMSFLLFGTVLYMLWVLTGMVEGFPLLWLMLSLALIGLGCWIYGRWSLPHKAARTRGIAVLLTLAAVGGGLWLGWPQKQEKKRATVPVFEHGMLWEPWSETIVQELTAAGKPVYIDFTAKWCLTCQVNKHVYSDARLQELFKTKGVTLVKADFTNEDPAIQAAFTALDRGAIPVNALYIPGQKAPLILPELLTVENVSEALRQIGK
ncbi:MAG: protein-disulfide reductase DsbD family protein, partial [Prosthecobacter sp.]